MKQILLLTSILFFSFSTFAQVGANNVCSGAIIIAPVTGACPATTYSLQNATATTGLGAGNYDAWYKFTTPANIRNVVVSIPTSPGGSLSAANLFIQAFPSNTCPSDLTGALGVATEGATGLSLTNLNPSTEYLFRVYSTTNPTGGTAASWNYTVCVSYTAVPANNDCSASSPVLTVGTALANQTVQNATTSTAPTGCATGTPDDDVWYRFTATQPYASVSVQAPGALLKANGAMVQVYSGACGSLTSIACGQEEVTITGGLGVGTQYYVRVYSSAAYSTTPAVGSGNNFSILVSSPSRTNITAGKTNEVYRQTTISTLNSNPWEVTYGPDNYLWITEARGYRLNRMNPVTGAKQVVLDLSFGSTFLPAPDQPFNAQFNIYVNGAQGGFAGMALHPNFTGATGGQNYVYLSYVGSFVSGVNFINRIVRFVYNPSTNRLESPVSICDTIPGSPDHNSQRMIITPMTQGGSDYYLFYAAGDMGAGQAFPAANVTRPMKAQNIQAYEGKILRFALSDTCGGGGNQAWIPASNPYNNVAPIVGKTAVWNIGQRNNQGFAYNPATNILYGSSHGPYSDDEINIIEGFKNYGHPLVIGYAADGNYNGNASTGTVTSISAGSPWPSGVSATSTCPPIGNETTRMNAINANALLYGAYKDPIFSAYPGPISGTLSVANVWATNPTNADWHSEGWSGLGIYTNTVIPGWKNTLLAAGLKWGRTIRLKLNDAGTAVIKTIPSLASPQSDTVTFFQSTNRYRDMAFSPNGRDIYVGMDSSAAASAATVGNPSAVVAACRGCVVRYEFLGYNPTGSSPFESTIPNYIPIDSSTNAGCVTATAVTINAANGNNNLWVPITGPNGNIIAEIDANNQDLGNITTSFFTRTGNPVRTAFANRYLNRNVTIGVQNAPGASVSVRLYLTAKELADMIATSGSGVSSITDVAIYKNNDACGTSMASIASGQTITGRYTQSTFGHAVQFNVTSFSSFYFLSSSSTLPFELFSFTGKAVNDASKLEWVVNTQIDVLSYTVERSLDNRNFDAIATVTAKDGQGNITYNFTDFNAGKLASTVYYRIRSNETNGAGKYTQIININFGSILITSLSVFPNPVVEKTNVLINAIADETAQLKVVDNIGRVVYSVAVKLVKGKNNIQLDMSRFKTGMYYVDVTGKAINEKTKLIKQ